MKRRYGLLAFDRLRQALFSAEAPLLGGSAVDYARPEHLFAEDGVWLVYLN
jgi:hypothetical protein